MDLGNLVADLGAGGLGLKGIWGFWGLGIKDLGF